MERSEVIWRSCRQHSYWASCWKTLVRFRQRITQTCTWHDVLHNATGVIPTEGECLRGLFVLMGFLFYRWGGVCKSWCIIEGQKCHFGVHWTFEHLCNFVVHFIEVGLSSSRCRKVHYGRDKVHIGHPNESSESKSNLPKMDLRQICRKCVCNLGFFNFVGTSKKVEINHTLIATPRTYKVQGDHPSLDLYLTSSQKSTA